MTRDPFGEALRSAREAIPLPKYPSPLPMPDVGNLHVVPLGSTESATGLFDQNLPTGYIRVLCCTLDGRLGVVDLDTSKAWAYSASTGMFSTVLCGIRVGQMIPNSDLYLLRDGQTSHMPNVFVVLPGDVLSWVPSGTPCPFR